MADLVLLSRSEVGHRTAKFGEVENWIVAKASGSRWAFGNSTFADRVKQDRLSIEIWWSKGDKAPESGSPFLIWGVFHHLQNSTNLVIEA